MSKTRENPAALPPMSRRTQKHPGFARPKGVSGRMKPVKGARALRRWAKEADPEDDARVSDAMDELLLG